MRLWMTISLSLGHDLVRQHRGDRRREDEVVLIGLDRSVRVGGARNPQRLGVVEPGFCDAVEVGLLLDVARKKGVILNVAPNPG